MLFPSMRLKCGGIVCPSVTKPIPFSTVTWCVSSSSSST